MKYKHKSVLLLGSYGQTNIGDDILMYNFLKLLVERGYRRVYVNVAEKKFLRKQLLHDFGVKLKIHNTYETSTLDWLRVLKKCDLVIYGGGTIFKDLYASTGRSKHGVVFRIVLLNLVARLLNKKVYNLFVGIGSIRTVLGRYLTKAALMLSHKTYLRDAQSYKYAKDTLGICGSKIIKSTDGIFITQDWGESEMSIKKLEPTRHVVGVNLLSDIPDWVDRTEYILALREFLAKIVSEGDCIIFMPFQEKYNENNDRTFIKKYILSALPNKKSYFVCENVSLADLEQIYSAVDYFVGMRFHSLLLAAIYHRPFLAIEYDTKCTQLMKDMHYKLSLDIGDVSGEALYGKYSELVKSSAYELRAIQNKYIERQQNIISKDIEGLML